QGKVLLPGVAVRQAGRLIDVEEAARLRVDHLDAVVGTVDERPEQEQRLFRPDVIRDVDHDGAETGGPSSSTTTLTMLHRPQPHGKPVGVDSLSRPRFSRADPKRSRGRESALLLELLHPTVRVE